MSSRSIRRAVAALALALAVSLVGTRPAYAHCDGLDGPVVEAGRSALESGDVRYALAWVLAEGEPEVRRAFDHALQVRGLGDEARELADRFFYETLVRVHRQGEGEPYTGLKPAGRDLGPAILAADRALRSGSLTELETLLIERVRHSLRERFLAAEAARDFPSGDVAAGREYVAAYVPFLHYAESVHEVGRADANGHGAPTTGAAAAAGAHDAH